MYGRAIAIFAVVLAIGPVALGCGSSSGSSSGSSDSNASSGESSGSGESSSGESSGSSTVSLTKAEYIKQGDAICKKVPARYQAELKALEKSAKSKPSVEETNLKAAVPPLHTASAELGELGAPGGDEQQAQAIVAALEKAAEGLEAKPESELTGPKSPFAEFQKLTEEYGFKVCSQL